MDRLKEYLNGLSKEVLIEEYVTLYQQAESSLAENDWLVELLLANVVGAERSMEEVAAAQFGMRAQTARDHHERYLRSAEEIVGTLGFTLPTARRYIADRIIQFQVSAAIQEALNNMGEGL